MEIQDRLRLLGISRHQLEQAQAISRSGNWTEWAVKTIGAYLWSLCAEGVGFNMPGEIVCRHVGAWLYLSMKADGVPVRLDVWKMKPGQTYWGHVTISYQPLLKGGVPSTFWYYTDWVHFPDQVRGASRRIRPGFEGDMAGLPPMKTDPSKVDVEYMANLRSDGTIFGRPLESWERHANDDEITTWFNEFVDQRQFLYAELKDKTAFEKVGRGVGKRYILT